MPEATCPTCSHTFSVLEGVSVTECPACGDGLLIEGDHAERAVGPGRPMMWYYVDSNGQQAGPVTENHTIKLVGQGLITSETLVWREDMSDWRRLNDSSLTALAGVVLSEGIAAAVPPAQTLPQGLAIAGMVTGIIGVVFSIVPCCALPFLGLPLDLTAMILSGVALQQVKAGKAGGRGMAQAGLILSIVGIGLLIIGVLWFGFMLGAHETGVF